MFRCKLRHALAQEPTLCGFFLDCGLTAGCEVQPLASSPLHDGPCRAACSRKRDPGRSGADAPASGPDVLRPALSAAMPAPPVAAGAADSRAFVFGQQERGNSGLHAESQAFQAVSPGPPHRCVS